MRLHSKLLALVLSVLMPTLACANDTVGNERFGQIQVVRGASPEGPVVILIGYSSPQSIATRDVLVNESELLIELDTAQDLAGIAATDKAASCSYLAGEIERLAQSVQNTQSLPTYKLPIIVGVGPGAAIARAAYAQHPKSFAALATWGACGEVALGLPLCKGDEFAPGYDRERKRVTFSLQRPLSGEMLAVASGCRAEPLAEQPRWEKELRALIHKHHVPIPDTRALPIIEIRAKKAHPALPLVVFLSGDGGWATIDKRLGEYLSEQGVDVVGFDTLRFCWSRKTPAESAQAISQIIAKYRRLWHRDKVALIGFSLGAEHIPFIYPLLSGDIQATAPLAILLSPGKGTDFEVHISDWLGIEAAEERYSVTTAIDGLTGVKLACIYGSEDATDSACPRVTLPGVTRRELPGGHHFDGEYKTVAALIFALLRGWALGEG